MLLLIVVSGGNIYNFCDLLLAVLVLYIRLYMWFISCEYKIPVSFSVTKTYFYMGLVVRKSVFGGLRTAKAQTSLHIRAV